MNNNRINIIKHIEEKEDKDIFQDYNEILMILDGEKYTHAPIYDFIYSYADDVKRFHEFVQNKIIISKSQIANRIQYIKQSGYKFKEYFTCDNSLTIVFE